MKAGTHCVTYASTKIADAVNASGRKRNSQERAKAAYAACCMVAPLSLCSQVSERFARCKDALDPRRTRTDIEAEALISELKAIHKHASECARAGAWAQDS
jgi:hypothetical protein